MNENNECPFCKSKAEIYPDSINDKIFYMCPICGRFELNLDNLSIINDNRVASYLYYNRFLYGVYPTEYRYHTTMKKELCDEYNELTDKEGMLRGRPVHFDEVIIDAWYPKTFAERIDKILLNINSRAKHIGQEVIYKENEVFSLLFVDRKDEVPQNNDDVIIKWRNRDDCLKEAQYLINYLGTEGYIEIVGAQTLAEHRFRITPKGYARIDEIQKNTSYGRQAFVAMKFGEETKPLREAIRKGINDAGYVAIFIDEVQHNEFITPEILKHIKNSKFVVVDLTHSNAGAYLEEGYALGLGKPVIQLCKSDVIIHFDVAQKNTIMWDKEDDIPVRLNNRIKATID